ncbi:MAG: putative Ig domain-containing protein [bacterium]
MNFSCSVTIKPTGGTKPYSYYIPTLPYGIHFAGSEDSLVIYGTHSSGGSFPINLTVTDADTNQVTKQFNLLIVHEVNLTGTWSYKVSGHRDLNGCECETDDRWTQTYTLNIAPEGDDFVANGSLAGDGYWRSVDSGTCSGGLSISARAEVKTAHE